jgi:hypothetical protein
MKMSVRGEAEPHMTSGPNSADPWNELAVSDDQELSPEDGAPDRISTEAETGSETRGNEYTPWDQFGVEEYVSRNYGNRLLREDALIIRGAASGLQASGIALHSLNHVADIGAGPNFYPAMLLAAYVAENGTIDLIEYSTPNRSYMETVIDGTDSQGPLAGVWTKFEDAMIQEGEQWQGTLLAARAKARVLEGSIYDLPKSEYDAISSFFVSESITDDRQQFQQAVRSLVEAVKPGGFIMVAHMIGSEGYPAGEGTHFPAVSVTTEYLQQVYSDIAEVNIVQVSGTPEAREGYHGMAIAVGRRVTH